MQTKTLLSGIFLLAALTTQAQESEKAKPTGYISLNAGIGSPMGDFSNKYIGGATSGTNVGINFSMPLFKSHFGLTTKLDFGIYEMSYDPFIEQQKSVLTPHGYQQGIDYDFGKISNGSYGNFNLLEGLYVTIPIKRLSVDARALIGMNITSRPELVIDFNDYYDNYYATYRQESTSSTTFAYDIGIGLRYNLGKKQRLCLTLDADIIGTNAAFTFKSKCLYNDGSGLLNDDGIRTITGNYSITTSIVMLGIGYVFGGK